MRVLLFSNLFPTSRDPNRGLFTRQLAVEMARLCELEVAVPLPWFPANGLAARLLPNYAREFGGLADTLDFDGVRATYLRYPLIPRLSEGMHHRYMHFGVRRHIARLHAERRFDAINAHWLYPDGAVATRLGAELGIPVVLTALGCDANDYLGDAGKRPHILASLNAAAAVTAVSAPLGDALLAAGLPPARLTVIPNGVDTSRFSPRDRAAARRKLGVAGDAPLVVCVSRLSHEKGVAVLVDAARELSARLPALQIAVVGEGAERAALERQIAAHSLGDRVKLVGAVPHEAVADWMAAADVVCMPSLREGHPNAAMEALACGRPLVASRVGALVSLVTAQRGLLVEPQQPAALAAALATALTQPWDAAAIAGSMRDESWARSAATYCRVLRQVTTPSVINDDHAAAQAG